MRYNQDTQDVGILHTYVLTNHVPYLDPYSGIYTHLTDGPQDQVVNSGDFEEIYQIQLYFPRKNTNSPLFLPSLFPNILSEQNQIRNEARHQARCLVRTRTTIRRTRTALRRRRYHTRRKAQLGAIKYKNKHNSPSRANAITGCISN